MRQGQQNKRPRGRNRKGPNPLARSYESNGPDVKIRGTALHIAEKYVMLARDAQTSGDRVASENYLQHAEHYYRIVAAAQAQMPQPQAMFRADDDDDGEEEGPETGGGERPRDPNQQPREFRSRDFQGDRPRDFHGDRPRDFQPRERRDHSEQPGGGAPGFSEGQPHVNGNAGGPPNANGGADDQPQYYSEDRRDDQGGEGFRGRRRRSNRGRGRRPEGDGLPYAALNQMSGDEGSPSGPDQSQSDD
ncbi:MAG: DUF4167 domain-containing protein [Bauldia sp.]